MVTEDIYDRVGNAGCGLDKGETLLDGSFTDELAAVSADICKCHKLAKFLGQIKRSVTDLRFELCSLFVGFYGFDQEE